MAQKPRIYNGHSYTAKMLQVGQRVRRKHDMALRQYLAIGGRHTRASRWRCWPLS